VIKVGDRGVGFDSEVVNIPNIDEKIHSSHKRGWGIQLMKELMDTVEFKTTAEGTTVTMTKAK
jgi:anti-sigma regulatory factor (Ser/Thr protein kinase)